MIKFQIGKLTLKNFLLHWFVSIVIMLICSSFIFKFNYDFVDILGLSIFPGSLSSILLISFIKGVIQDIKEKEYLVVIGTIIFVIVFTKFFFKL